MSYTAKENAMKIDMDAIKNIEEALNKGYAVELMHDSETDDVYILFNVQEKPENWPENIKLTDSQIHSIETILSHGRTAKLDCASIIMVNASTKDLKPLFTE